MKKINTFYKKDREEFTTTLEKHIAETSYCIDRAYKTKSAGFKDLYILDFKELSKVSYVVIDGLDMKVADSAKEDELRKYDIFKASKYSKHYVYVAYGINGDVLGIDRIKSLGSNKTKLTNAYNLTIKFSDNNLEIKSRLSSLRVGKRYTSTDIVNLLQSCYDDLNIDRKAVSNDIKNYFIVSKTQVVSEIDGKRKQGFKIISDLYK